MKKISMRQQAVRDEAEIKQLRRVVERLRLELTSAMSLLPEPNEVVMRMKVPENRMAEAAALAMMMQARIDKMAAALTYDGKEI